MKSTSISHFHLACEKTGNKKIRIWTEDHWVKVKCAPPNEDMTYEEACADGSLDDALAHLRSLLVDKFFFTIID